jgi:hypothetical protein
MNGGSLIRAGIKASRHAEGPLSQVSGTKNFHVSLTVKDLEDRKDGH